MCTANGLDMSAWRPDNFAKLTLRAGGRGAKGLLAPTPDNLKDVTRGALQDTGDLFAGRRSRKKIEASYATRYDKPRSTILSSSSVNARQAEKRRKATLLTSTSRDTGRTILGG